MTTSVRIRCAIYTRKSSEEGLEQSFNSLDAQREACEAYIVSQRHEGWQLIPTQYDDGGFSGGNMERPALKRLLDDIAAKRVDTVVVYKVDRLTRSLADFAKIVEQFDKQGISFVSVTQQFNTTTSMGRLTLNVLLSFAQFEREVTGERIRDKIAASKRKGMWMGGVVPLGYDLADRHLVLNPAEADQVQEIYRTYLKLGCVTKLQAYLEQAGVRSKKRMSRTGRASGGASYSRGALYLILHNRIYLGDITHKGTSYPGQHPAIIEQRLWEQVQLKFQSNLQAARKRPRATEQSLLMGLLYDEHGHRFTPSHATKKGRRYRYYVSQAVIKKTRSKHAGPVRIPASEIEELVLSQLTLLLRSPQRLMDILADSDASLAEVQAITEASREWSAASSEKIQQLLRLTVKRILVRNERIEIEIIRSTLRQTVLGVSDDPALPGNKLDDLVAIEATAQLKRCGGEVRLVLPPDSPGAKPHSVPSLIRAISRAHDWVDRILRGEAVNQRSIAKETGLDERYISRVIPLAFLAPDLTEAILEGKQAAHLSLDTCLGNIPDDWNQQRAQLSGN
ncbi:MAG TPA: recombinase family protein [Acidobacteriaceae bacterium]|jgi:DNA invertase Pin-like site-specific DNA recombinase|nr:recombinase family protein [Acidobacteriaceae bacterium]